MEHNASANGGMLATRLTASMPTSGPLTLARAEQAQVDAHESVSRRQTKRPPLCARPRPPPPRDLRQRTA
eukprot:5118611-Prymnesium_polylepis.1